MATELVPLSSHEHGTIYLTDNKPAVGAEAWVDAPVYADRGKTRVLSQPLIADRAGRLPGFVEGNPAVRAWWRGRDAQPGPRRPPRAIVAALADHFERQARDADLAAAAEAEAEFRREEAEIRARAELEARQRAERPLSLPPLTLTPPIPRRTPFTVGVPVSDTTVDVAAAFTADYEPVYDPNLAIDVFSFSGFGIDTVNQVAYYDTAGATPGQEAALGFVPPDTPILVRP